MSIVIKGMEMPPGCYYGSTRCFFNEGARCMLTKREPLPQKYDFKSWDCPLVEVPVMDEWCTDCREYDREKHCCPRFNRVIRSALDVATIFQNSKDMTTILEAETNTDQHTDALNRPTATKATEVPWWILEEEE